MSQPALHDTPTPLPAAETWPDAAGTNSLAVSFVAEVIAETDGAFELRTGRQRWTGRCAVSGLVAPMAGDQVACWRVAQQDGSDAVFVVAVLTRASPCAAVCVRIGSGVALSGEDGALKVEASRSLRLQAPECELQVGKVSLVYRTLQSIGDIASATVGQMRLVGAMLSTVFDQQVHHARQYQRSTDGVDRVDAQVIQQHASSLLQLQGENVLANGERVIKMQGTQIHLG